MIDPLSGNVHSVIITGSDHLEEVYIITASDIFRDIRRKLRATVVGLPTIEDMLYQGSRRGKNKLAQQFLKSYIHSAYSKRAALQAAAEVATRVLSHLNKRS